MLFRSNKNSVINTVKKDTTLIYTSYIHEDEGSGITLYIPSEKGTIHLEDDNNYEFIGDALNIKKTKGFIGEGLFGEKKDDKVDTSGRTYNEEEQEIIPNNNENNNQENNIINNDEKSSKTISTEIIIICALSCIIVALTTFIIIKLVNKKKKESGVKNEFRREEVKNLSNAESKVSNEEKE